MRPVIQEEKTGCGIAALACILGKSYEEMKTIANSMGIYATDEFLWSDTKYIRRLLKANNFETGCEEIPFQTWCELPAIALLSINHYKEKGRNYWHWVVFNRTDEKAIVFDSASYLSSNIRNDFESMQPKWFIKVIPN